MPSLHLAIPLLRSLRLSVFASSFSRVLLLSPRPGGTGGPVQMQTVTQQLWGGAPGGCQRCWFLDRTSRNKDLDSLISSLSSSGSSDSLLLIPLGTLVPFPVMPLCSMPALYLLELSSCLGLLSAGFCLQRLCLSSLDTQACHSV